MSLWAIDLKGSDRTKQGSYFMIPLAPCVNMIYISCLQPFHYCNSIHMKP